MIKLTLPAKPTKLTAKLQAEKTAVFINSINSNPKKPKKVWGMEWLKKAVLEMSFGKCCYTEIRLNVESKYMEIEHFYPKKNIPEKCLNGGIYYPLVKNVTLKKMNTM